MKPAKSKLIDKIAVNNEKHMKKRMKRFRIAESEKKKRNERLLKDSFNFSLSFNHLIRLSFLVIMRETKRAKEKKDTQTHEKKEKKHNKMHHINHMKENNKYLESR